MQRATFLNEIKKLNPKADVHLIGKAFDYSREAHQGQFRKSGHPFFEHCIQVAVILAEQGLDSITVAAGLLHDTVEDAGVRIEELKDRFGREIADLVNGVSKIGGLAFRSKEESQAEYYRKMIVSMAKDIRVILIKFADRLHNMRTLEHLPADRIERIAQETRDVYAPLAHRLGMDQMKREMEDLSLKFLQPKIYREFSEKIALSTEARERYIDLVKVPLTEALEEVGIQATITGRAKHLASIYRKIRQRHKPLEEIYDLTAMRVVTQSVQDCYHVLGIIHHLWRPIPGRFKDFIAMPKSNMYQALHTTVMGPQGEPVEIQIRTEDMHRTAEMGIAAHWLYKEGRKSPDELDEYMSWLRQVLDWQRDLTDPREFMEYLKFDLYGEEIFVFTPKGDLKPLPRGATPLDFAFAVHTDVGHHCQGVKVNDRMVPLASPLRRGDTVQIITSPSQHPSRDWLKLVKTSRAKSKIRHWLRGQRHRQSLSLGKEMLERELKKRRGGQRSSEELSRVAGEFGLPDVEHFYVALGSGDLSLQQVLGRLGLGAAERKSMRTATGRRTGRQPGEEGRGVQIQGLDSLMIRFAKCCQPIPGDPIVGFVTRGRGISIHRANCPNSVRLMKYPERQVSVEWDTRSEQSFPVIIEVVAHRRMDVLSDLTRVVSDMGAEVRDATVKAEGEALFGTFRIGVRDLQHLHKIMDKLRRVKGTDRVFRRTREVD
jgi:guanosine-3',5'-bis(diphosphate) 3'-pyrophosphohydrolase